MTARHHVDVAQPARLGDAAGSSERLGPNLWLARSRVAAEIILLATWPFVLATTASALGQRVQHWSSLGWLDDVPTWAWLATGAVMAALIGLLLFAKPGSSAPQP